jgi:type IV secretion system protein VirB4
MESLMQGRSAVLPILTYLFHRLEAQFDGSPSWLILDEAWVFLDDPLFANRIREWLKTLRKKNVSVVFATQSLADIQRSSIAPALIESCPSRIFLPSPQAIEPQLKGVYESFGLNDRQIELIARATPKRDYYYHSRLGARWFDLNLHPVALAFAGASRPEDQRAIDAVLKDPNPDSFAAKWLSVKNLAWASKLINDF